MFQNGVMVIQALHFQMKGSPLQSDEEKVSHGKIQVR